MESSLAVLADIHGNRWALEAVLEDVDRRGVQTIVDLGDSVYGPLDPAGTAARLMDRGIAGILGNQDRVLLEPPGENPSPTWRYTYESLSTAQRNWLAARPVNAVFAGQFFLCHGTPESDSEYLLELPSESGGVLRSNAGIAERLRGIAQPVILCGHSHTARCVWLPDGRMVANPGSVGLPAYADDAPVRHAMQAGAPHARYCLFTPASRGWRVEEIALTYDWEAAAGMAQANDRPDWAAWLRSGRAGN